MHTKCRYHGASRTEDGNLVISFIAEESARSEMEQLKGIDLSMDVETYKKKKSLNANNYFWKLCQLIAEKIGSTKDAVYLDKLSTYSRFEAFDIPLNAIPLIEKSEEYRFIEIDHKYPAEIITEQGSNLIEMAEIHCWKGSHTFDSAQMSRLIDGTVSDAHDLGISTLTPNEILHLVSMWKGQK